MHMHIGKFLVALPKTKKKGVAASKANVLIFFVIDMDHVMGVLQDF